MPDASALDPALRRHARAELRLAKADDEAQTITLTASRKTQANLISAGDISKGTGAMAPIVRKLPDGSCLVDSQCDNPVDFAFAVGEVLGEKFLPRAIRTNSTGVIFGAMAKGRRWFRASTTIVGAS